MKRTFADMVIPLCLVLMCGCLATSDALRDILDDAGNDTSDTSGIGGTGTYPIVDTGQAQTYDNDSAISVPSRFEAFYGQDAQFDGNQPRYTINTDGLTVHDNVTGLTWTRSADFDNDGDIDAGDKMTYDEALAYVDTLNEESFGGYTDWQLPEIKQLYSLIDFRGTDPDPDTQATDGLVPFIDTDYFNFAYGDTTAGERVIDSQWATSTLYVADDNLMFGVNFADGRIKGYGRTTPGSTSEKTFYVRYCRGSAIYGLNTFTDNDDGTITDAATGLMWTQADSGEGLDWEDALAYVQSKNARNHLGYDDWRLPNAKELQSIVDYRRSPDTTDSAAIDTLFDTTTITNEDGQDDYPFFWTSTTFLRADGSASMAVYVAFGRGLGFMNGEFVDIHGAGCQRSDPKTGDPGDYPKWGMGPQGDVQRVFNYVRLVR